MRHSRTYEAKRTVGRKGSRMSGVTDLSSRRKRKPNVKKAEAETEMKDTRTTTCYTRGCADYGRERPITEKCSCGGKPKPIAGAGR